VYNGPDSRFAAFTTVAPVARLVRQYAMLQAAD